MRMDREEFLREIEKIDYELAEEGVQIYNRSFLAFLKIAKGTGYNGPIMGFGVDPTMFPDYVGPNLIARISEWYSERYGERHLWDPVRGKVPIFLRKEIYLLRIPLVFGAPQIEIFSLVEGLTEGLIKSLSDGEKTLIKRAFEDGFPLIYQLEDLATVIMKDENIAIPQEAVGLFNRAIEDKAAAIKCLEDKIDANGSCFHSQQHAEKMLKTYLVAMEICTSHDLQFRPFGHNLENIYNKCNKDSSDFINISNEIALLKNITMDIRYSVTKISAQIAVDTFWASLKTGSFCARKILGHQKCDKA